MPTTHNHTDILTLDELHTYLKIPKPTLYSLAQNGRIPAAKIGKHWRFRKAYIDTWFDSQKRSGPIPRRTRKSKVNGQPQ